MYKNKTLPVPINNDKGKFRLGFSISPAVKVMLFQASALKIEPTNAAAKMPMLKVNGVDNVNGVDKF
jgi:hypothetical protein